MEEKEIYIHIGYPKTATTTLQNYLFPNHSELNYLRQNNLSLNFIKEIFFGRENSLKRNLPKIKNELSTFIKDTQNKYIYSEESLTSFSMFFRFSPSPYIWTLEPNSIARKLKITFNDTKVFDNTKIIITIRKQDNIIKSMYTQVYNFVFKRFRETKTFEKFLKYSFENKDQFILDAIDYNNVIKTYEELFGKENICVLVFEELKKDKESYIRKLTNFMGIDYEEALSLVGTNKTNSRSSNKGIYKSDERRITELLGYYKSKLGIGSLGLSQSFVFKLLDKIYISGRKLRIDINDEYDKKLEELYKKGNQELSKRYDLDLEKWGYYYEKN